MAMSYDTALIVEGDLVKITGIQDTANLEADTEHDRTDLILSAHRHIYARVESKFGTAAPATFTNQSRLNGAVAWETIKRYVLGGYLDKPSVEDCQAQVDREFDAFVPDLSSGATESSVGVPAISQLDSGWAYGPSTGRRIGQRPWNTIPRSS